MRQTISAALAAVAVIAAAPAMACGFDSCSPCGFYGSPCASAYVPTVTYAYTGCGTCGGWAFERLADPETQYYYVNQGPTYSGPGAFAPYPTYQESAVPAWGGVYGDAPYYAYTGRRYAGAYGYRWRHRYHYRPWHQSYRYGYRQHYYGYHHGYPRRYY